MSKSTIMLAAGLLLAIANLISYLLMRYDKRCAQRGARRVPEARLFLATALFGGLGGVLGMQRLRHKTKHWYFKIFFPLLLILQLLALVFGVYWLFQ